MEAFWEKVLGRGGENVFPGYKVQAQSDSRTKFPSETARDVFTMLEDVNAGLWIRIYEMLGFRAGFLGAACVCVCVLVVWQRDTFRPCQKLCESVCGWDKKWVELFRLEIDWLRQLSESHQLGMELGAHTHSHTHKPLEA